MQCLLLKGSKDVTWKNKNNFKVFTSLKFIAMITQHISEPSFQLGRNYPQQKINHLSRY